MSCIKDYKTLAGSKNWCKVTPSSPWHFPKITVLWTQIYYRQWTILSDCSLLGEESIITEHTLSWPTLHVSAVSGDKGWDRTLFCSVISQSNRRFQGYPDRLPKPHLRLVKRVSVDVTLDLYSENAGFKSRTTYQLVWILFISCTQMQEYNPCPESSTTKQYLDVTTASCQILTNSQTILHKKEKKRQLAGLKYSSIYSWRQHLVATFSSPGRRTAWKEIRFSLNTRMRVIQSQSGRSGKD